MHVFVHTVVILSHASQNEVLTKCRKERSCHRAHCFFDARMHLEGSAPLRLSSLFASSTRVNRETWRSVIIFWVRRCTREVVRMDGFHRTLSAIDYAKHVQIVISGPRSNSLWRFKRVYRTELSDIETPSVKAVGEKGTHYNGGDNIAGFCVWISG